jgi:hypothetical protein
MMLGTRLKLSITNDTIMIILKKLNENRFGLKA